MAGFVSALGNPWLQSEWNLTKQGEFLLRYGSARAEEFATAAGTSLGGIQKKPIGENTVIRNFILIKRIGATGGSGGGGGGGVIGAGTSGSGPPT